MAKTKDETISCRVTTEQKEWLQQRAMIEDQTLSKIVYKIIKEFHFFRTIFYNIRKNVFNHFFC